MTDLATQGLGGDGLFVERPSSIKTFTGRVDPLNPVPDEINIEDIAHALSRQCRYNGHCVGFISVARHSIWVRERLARQGHDQRLQLTGLLHDAAEAYLGDLVRPIKHTPFGATYLEVEEVLEKVIMERFGLPFPIPQEVRDADNYVLTELELPDLRYTYHGDYVKDEIAFLVEFNALLGDV
jgi:5'-deoxynucleotidase YfbR-like HD superfamily hydrolase